MSGHGAALLFVCLFTLLSVLVLARAQSEDVCERCSCLPVKEGIWPVQAICNGPKDKPFLPKISNKGKFLEFIFIYGIETVNITEMSLQTDTALTLIIQNCQYVDIVDTAVGTLRTLVVRDASRVTVGALPQDDLWATVFENIDKLVISASSLSAVYSVRLGKIGSMTVEPIEGEPDCKDNPELKFLMFNSYIRPVPKGGFLLCGGEFTFNGNTFQHISEDGIQITSEKPIIFVFNKFENLTKEAFNLTSPEIQIASNHFEHLPAGALRGISALEDAFFNNNTIVDIDLGGVLLDMSWDMVIEHNTVDCDCASKRTSILNPKEELLILSNSSLHKLESIFLNNFCHLDCPVSLKMFSFALQRREVCVSNNTELEEEVLCEIAVTSVEPTSPSYSSTEEVESTVGYSKATRTEFILPFSIILVFILVITSAYFGCRELNSFKYKFSPNRQTIALPKRNFE